MIVPKQPGAACLHCACVAAFIIFRSFLKPRSGSGLWQGTPAPLVRIALLALLLCSLGLLLPAPGPLSLEAEVRSMIVPKHPGAACYMTLLLLLSWSSSAYSQSFSLWSLESEVRIRTMLVPRHPSAACLHCAARAAIANCLPPPVTAVPGFLTLEAEVRSLVVPKHPKAARFTARGAVLIPGPFLSKPRSGSGPCSCPGTFAPLVCIALLALLCSLGLLPPVPGPLSLC